MKEKDLQEDLKKMADGYKMNGNYDDYKQYCSVTLFELKAKVGELVGRIKAIEYDMDLIERIENHLKESE